MSKISELRPDVNWAEDGDRVGVLLGPFQDKNLNPEGYEAKMAFWTDTIERWLIDRKTFRFNMEDLATGLAWNGQKPRCLEEVLAEMLAKGSLKTETQLRQDLDRRLSATWSSWTWQVLKTGSSAAWTKFSGKPVSGAAALIHRGSLTRKIDALRTELPPGKVVELTDPGEDSQLLLDCMKAENGADYRLIEGKIYIKLAGEGGKAVRFDDKDAAAILLRDRRSKLDGEIESLDAEISSRRAEVKQTLASGGSRLRAKMALKQAKRLENSLEQKLAALDKLDVILGQVDMAKDNAEVVDTLRNGKKLLADRLDEIPSVETIDDLVDDIGELVQESDAIAEALGRGDEVDLEQELDELIAADEEKAIIEALDKLDVVDDEELCGDTDRPVKPKAQLAI